MMKNWKRFGLLWLLLGISFLLPWASKEAEAAQTSKTLQSGRVYTFVNGDARTLTYLSLPSGTRYDYVSRDVSGEVVDFGVAMGRIPVRSGGSLVLALTGGSASVTFDAEKISAAEAPGSALTRLTLAENETVILSNLADAAAQVAFDNTGLANFAQYDIAALDQTGTAVFIGEDVRYTTVSIPAAGSATVTAKNHSLKLMYPTVWVDRHIRVVRESHSALDTYPLERGKTYTLTHTGDTDSTLSISSAAAVKYNYIRMNQRGYTTDYGYAAQGDRLTLTQGETLYITLSEAVPGTEGSAVKLMIPGEQQAFLTVQEGGAGEMSLFTAAVGETLTIVNNSATVPYTLRAESSDSPLWLDYIYDGGAFSETQYATDAVFTEMTVNAGAVWTLTVKKGALDLRLPTAWLTGGLQINRSAHAALTEYTLAAGQSLKLTNTNPAQSYEVHLAGIPEEGLLSYDYSIAEETGLQYGTGHSASVITLPPNSQVTLTAGISAPMSVHLPAVDTITRQEGVSAAVTRHPLAPGASLRVTNPSEQYAYTLTPQSAAHAGTVMLDYVLKNETNQITDFGQTAVNTPYRLEAQESVLFTNGTSAQVTIMLPLAGTTSALITEPSEAPALTHRSLAAGNGLEIANLDKLYHHNIQISAANGTTSAQYEYIMETERSRQLDFGISEGHFDLGVGKSVVITPVSGGLLSLTYPAEWQDSVVRITETEAEPLYRMVLAPDKRLKLDNRGNSQHYEIQIAGGAYYLRYGTDNSRVTAADSALSGNLEVSPQTTVTIIAAKGADITILMPQSWANVLMW